MERGTFQLMKSVNRTLILNKIRENAPISRAQIAKETKLTPPTVSSIVKELIEQDLVQESTLGESQGGRKPTLLLVNKNGYYVVGVDAGPTTVVCVLSNLAGEVCKRIVLPITPNQTNASFLSLIKEGITQVLQQASYREKVLGIGVAMHGVVDVTTGTSVFAPVLQLKDIPLQEELENTFGLEVRMENDARAMALGEAWFGEYEPKTNMLTLNLGSGVGAGVLIEGKLYEGAFGLAGEVGHMTIALDGEQCECGNLGCLQAYASAPAITRRANEQMPSMSITTSEEVYQLAEQNHERSIQLLEETGDKIGIGLANLVHVINPALIIIGGGVAKAEKYIHAPMARALAERGLTEAAKSTPITFSEIGDDATILGAVALVLQEVFGS